MNFEVAAVAKALDLDQGVFAAQRLALERAGFLRRRGRFVEVVPPLLAEHLASRALTNPERVISELEVVLPGRRLLPLFDRLAKLHGEGVRRLVDRLLREKCADFDGVLRHSEILRKLAPASPRTAIGCIEDGLKDVTPEALATILKGEARRALVWTLEDLALRTETFDSSAKQLLALAVAENESCANNATEVFLSLFYWAHPELSPSLAQRLAVLNECAASGSARQRKHVAAAAGAAFKRRVSIPLHHPTGPHLPELPFRRQIREVNLYALGVLALLQCLRPDPDANVRAAAVTATIDVFQSLIFISLRTAAPSEGTPSELAVQTFDALRDASRTAESASTHRAVITALELLSASLDAVPQKPASAAELTRMAAEMEAALMGSFRARLWRLIGPASWDQRRHWRHGTGERKEGIEGIATEFLTDPDYPALFESHLGWLMGSEARSANELLHALGSADTRRGLWASLIAVKMTAGGEERLSAYMRGWAEHDREGACAEANRLIASRLDLTRVLLGALAALFRNHEIVERIGRLLNGGVLERYEFATLLASAMPWEELDASDAEDLLTMVDDGTPRVRGALLVAFAVRLIRGGELTVTLRKRAWSFLEASCSLEEAPSQLWWDQLAAQLGEAEPQELLRVVKVLGLRKARADRGGMDPHLELPLTFETLRKTDHRGLVQMLLHLASQAEVTWWINTTIEEEIDPLVDREALLAFAREAGVEGARLVALHLNAEKPGFWEVARDLLAEWGNDDRVRQRLLSALPGGWSGSPLPMIKEHLDKAAALRSDPKRWVASWAQEAISFLEDWRRREGRDEQEEWIWDYRIRRAELEEKVRGPDSPDKLWAIGRLLEHAPRERVIELLSPKQILDALDNLPQLPERVRESWESWAKHWTA